MFGLLVRSVFEAGQDIFRGSVLSDIVQQWIGSNFLTLVSVLLGGVVFFVIVSLWRRGRRGMSSTFAVDFNNADVSLERVLQTPFRLTVKRGRQDPTKKKRKEKERDQPNGHPASAPDGGGVEDSEAARSPASPDGKPLKPKKKKRKTDIAEKTVVLSNDLFPTKDRAEEVETGVWERKMSSREKRQMRKERMKRKENPRGGSQQRPPKAEIRWNVPPRPEGEWQPRPPGGEPRGTEPRSAGGPPLRREARPQEPGKAEKTSRRAVEWVPPSGLEEDIFSHVGTWDPRDVKTEPVTFGTVPDLTSDFGNGLSVQSPCREEWSGQAASLGREDAWLEDPSEVDQTSDWKPPREEWGNWAGEEGALGQEAGQGQCPGRKSRTGHAPENKATPSSADDTNGKKERKKKRRMRKET